MYLASCDLIMRPNDLYQINLERINPPLTRVIITQKLCALKIPNWPN